MKNQTIWFTSPAKCWEEALPIGNGHLGGMVYGGVSREQVDLNLDTLWSGTGRKKIKKGSSGALYKAREAVLEGNYKAGEQILTDEFLNEWNESYLPLGSLYIETGDNGCVHDYKRSLCLEEGICRISYADQNGPKERELYCSHPHQAMIIQLQSPKKRMTAHIWLDSPMPHCLEKKEGSLLISGHAPCLVYPNYFACEKAVFYDEKEPGMAFLAALMLETDGTVINDSQKGYTVKDAHTITIALTGETGYDAATGRPLKSIAQLFGICLKRLDKCFQDGIRSVSQMHRKDFCSLSRRMQLSLGEEKKIPTDIRLEEFHSGASDLGLLELWFYFGRYLLISSSREGSMAANLQGIWNSDMRPAWSGNYTTNINVQMNYWLAEPGNLSQCHMPLLELIKGCMESGRETAAEQFGCRGFVVNHNIDLWKQTSPVGMSAQKPPVKYAYFPAASGWLCRHIWEHYRFTLEEDFLKDWYPVMREAALFYLDYLVEKDGFFLTAPSTSPENLFYDASGQACAVSAGTTMDTAIIRTLFKDCAQAAGLLCTDKELAEKLTSISDKMLPYQISAKGGLMEWSQDFPEVYKDHRHLSHLYGLYPGEEIHTEKNTNLAAACIKTLEQRTDEGPGWSKAWKACLWARLKDGERAFRLLRGLLTPVTGTRMSYICGGTYKNLLCAHPPFQIDGNFGGAAAVCEMLIQSHRESIELLPALPKEWQAGSVKGLCARGGYVFDFTWERGQICEIWINSIRNTICKVHFQNESHNFRCVKNEHRKVYGKDVCVEY